VQEVAEVEWSGCRETRLVSVYHFRSTEWHGNGEPHEKNFILKNVQTRFSYSQWPNMLYKPDKLH